MHRFFVPPDQVQGGTVRFSPPQSRQMARVLRLRAGHQVEALDNAGSWHLVELTEVSPMTALGTILRSGEVAGEPRVRLTLFQALLKGQKWEFLLQKGTELGISAVVPVVCQRCVSRYDGEAWASRAPRWRAILQEAAEQSGRGRIPELRPPAPWDAACQVHEGLGLLAYEGETTTSLREALAAAGPVSRVSLFVGPEGGFTGEEVDLARRCGVQPVSLGRRILRAETAGLAAVAAVFYALGELG